MAAARGSAGRTSLGSASGRVRVCKKLVLKGQATSQGATYVLYLKVDLTTTGQDELVPLIDEIGVELQEALTYRIDAQGATSAVTATAVAAARNLNIPLSFAKSMDAQRDLPQVSVTDDGRIQLTATASASYYMVVLHVRVNLLSQPPYAPFVVRLPKPFCLNNYLRFTVDESIAGSQDMPQVAVEVDPPILSARRNTARSSHASDMGMSDDGDTTVLEPPSNDSDDENDGATISGPFKSCDAVVLRFASEQAGNFVLEDTGLLLPSALRAESALSDVSYSSVTTADDMLSGNTVAFQANLELFRPYYAGLEREVILYLQLDSLGSSVTWRPKAVNASHGIVSWTMGGASAEDSQELPRAPTPDRHFDKIVWPDLSTNESADDEDLLKVAPLSGLNQAGLDFSLDLGAPSNGSQGRFAIANSSTTSDAMAAHRPSLVTSNVLMVAFNLLPLVQTADSIIVSISGLVELDPQRKVFYPGLRVPTTLTQHTSQVTVDPSLRSELPVAIAEAAIPQKPPTATAVDEALLQKVLEAIKSREAGPSTKKSSIKSIMFRSSHLLWTLLLTYLMFNLFTASQTANQALHVKIDELSRLLEQRLAVSTSHAIAVESLDLSDHVDLSDEVETWTDKATQFVGVAEAMTPPTKYTDLSGSPDTKHHDSALVSLFNQTISLPLIFLRHLISIFFRI